MEDSFSNLKAIRDYLKERFEIIETYRLSAIKRRDNLIEAVKHNKNEIIKLKSVTSKNKKSITGYYYGNNIELDELANIQVKRKPFYIDTIQDWNEIFLNEINNVSDVINELSNSLIEKKFYEYDSKLRKMLNETMGIDTQNFHLRRKPMIALQMFNDFIKKYNGNESYEKVYAHIADILGYKDSESVRKTIERERKKNGTHRNKIKEQCSFPP